MSTEDGYPETYIEDKEKAVDVAYASKDQRCLAVAARLVETALSEVGEVETRIFQDEVGLAERLYDIYEVYPEVFGYLNKKGKPLDPRSILVKVPVILEHNGLPLVETEVGVRRRTAEELDVEAEVREQIAAALFEFPPSDDFLKDFDLVMLRYPRTNQVDVVAELLVSVEFLKDRAHRHETKTADDLEFYEANDLKMRQMIQLLEQTWIELEIHLKNVEFGKRAIAALNNEDTKLSDLKKIWLEGRELVVQGYHDWAAEKQRTFDMILSGEATAYVHPWDE